MAAPACATGDESVGGFKEAFEKAGGKVTKELSLPFPNVEFQALLTEIAAAKPDARTPPTYLPLDPFVINLADKDSDRYAQIGITLEVESPMFADQMKGYMPAVRNAILMIIAHKTSKELLGRAGKEELADEIMREAVRPMGIDIAMPEPVTVAPVAAVVAASGAQDEAAPVEIKKVVVKRPGETVRNPVQHVHFSSFIIQ